jgi:hypothetical protein
MAVVAIAAPNASVNSVRFILTFFLEFVRALREKTYGKSIALTSYAGCWPVLLPGDAVIVMVHPTAG